MRFLLTSMLTPVGAGEASDGGSAARMTLAQSTLSRTLECRNNCEATAEAVVASCMRGCGLLFSATLSVCVEMFLEDGVELSGFLFAESA